MGVIRYKIWSDIWNNKARTLQVVLIIGLGAAALGMIIGTRNLVINGMASGWRAINPAMIALFADPRVDDDSIEVLKRIEGLEDVEGYAFVNIEWRLNPEDEWRPAGLVARDDYTNQIYNKVSLVSGEWPQDKVFAAEDSTLDVFGIPEGGQVYILVNDRERLVEIGGVIDDQVTQPPSFGGNAQFYTTRDRLADLTGIEGFDLILAGAPEFDREALEEIADEIQDKLEKQGSDSGGFLPPALDRVVDPNKHFFQDVMDGIFLVLAVLAVVALLLSLLLVYNTISAVLSQQVDQIGVMKAIGAKTGQILLVYLLTVFAYCFLSLMIALPLGALGGWFLTVFLLGSFNADPGTFGVNWPAVIAIVAVAVLAPLLASLVPIFSGAGITVNQAINTYGLSAKPNILDRTLSQIQRAPRLLLLAISNTFRNKGRVLLTEISLVLSGLIFMMVMGARDSAAFTFDDVLFSILNFNVNLSFEDPERVRRVEEMTITFPGVEAVEMWGFSGASIRLADQEASDDDEGTTLFGVPLPTTLYGPQMRAGRWLLPEDTNAVVLNQTVAEDAGVQVGDWVTFDHGVSGESTWQVVGLLFDPIITNSAHVPREALLREIGSVGRAGSVWIQTTSDDAASEEAVAKGLRAFYEENGIDVSPASPFGADTASEIRDQNLSNFGVIVTLLLVMAVLIGLVGSIALSGALSLSVLERRREIGVMRAIGASSGNVALLFVGEALILGLLSWAIAVPLSIPAGRLMAVAIGRAIGLEIVYKFTPTGALLWLAIIITLSIAASWLPARSAVRISVRESLAYQ